MTDADPIVGKLWLSAIGPGRMVCGFPVGREACGRVAEWFAAAEYSGRRGPPLVFLCDGHADHLASRFTTVERTTPGKE
jgi:hypothetical protein